MKIHNYTLIRIAKPKRQRKGVLVSSEPLFLLTFYREEDEEPSLVELTQKQIAKFLATEDVQLIRLCASIDQEGNWRKKEVRI